MQIHSLQAKVERTYNIFGKLVWPLRHIQHHLSTLFFFHFMDQWTTISPCLNEALADLAAHFLNSPKISPGIIGRSKARQLWYQLYSLPSKIQRKVFRKIPTENLDYILIIYPSMLISHFMGHWSLLIPSIKKDVSIYLSKIFHHYSDYKSLRNWIQKGCCWFWIYYDLEINFCFVDSIFRIVPIQSAKIHFLKKLKSLINDYHFDFQILHKPIWSGILNPKPTNYWQTSTNVFVSMKIFVLTGMIFYKST